MVKYICFIAVFFFFALYINIHYLKMKAIRLFSFVAALVMPMTLLMSCEDNNPETETDDIRLSVSFDYTSLDSLWGLGWDTEWLYNWNESSYGQLGYAMPDNIKGTFYNIDSKTGKRFNYFFKIFDPDGGRVLLPTGLVYDMLVYNFGTENVIFNQSDDFETYTATYRSQPDELSGAMVTGVDLSAKTLSGYDSDKDAEGNVVYVRNLNVELKPYSFIYLFQIVILNNKDVDPSTEGDSVVGARRLALTGVAESVDLFTRKTNKSTAVITTEDIKPVQNHKNVRLEDGSIVESADILAARILTWGIPEKASAIDRNYLGVDLTLSSGLSYTVTCDVTELIRQKPSGGVITVYVDANEFILY